MFNKKKIVKALKLIFVLFGKKGANGIIHWKIVQTLLS